MTLHHAKKLIIITEKLISQGICDIIEANGASGYTIVQAGGKGSRNIRSTPSRASVIDDFVNMKIEVIVNSDEMAAKIMEDVTEKYFGNYSGIAYLEDVEVLRPIKFDSNKE
jgi:nitrogen regulatory protein PII